MKFKDYLNSSDERLAAFENAHDFLHHLAEEELVACKVVHMTMIAHDIIKFTAECGDDPRVEGLQKDLSDRLTKRLAKHQIKGLGIMKAKVYHTPVRSYHLNKRVTEEVTQSAEEIVEIIKRDCGQWLAAAGRNKLYRGLKIDKVPNVLHTFTVRQDRKPRDIDPQTSKIIDNALEKVTGIKFRSQAIFGTGDKAASNAYGVPCVIFPIGNFDYCWSPAITDAWTYFTSVEHDPPIGLDDILDDDESFEDMLYDEWIERIYEYITSGKAKYLLNSRLPDAIKSGHELMIKCNSYYALYNNFPGTAKNSKRHEDLIVANKVLSILGLN